jgi:hypothetical protein
LRDRSDEERRHLKTSRETNRGRHCLKATTAWKFALVDRRARPDDRRLALPPR